MTNKRATLDHSRIALTLAHTDDFMIQVIYSVLVCFITVRFERKEFFYADAASQQSGPIMIKHFHPSGGVSGARGPNLA